MNFNIIHRIYLDLYFYYPHGRQKPTDQLWFNIIPYKWNYINIILIVCLHMGQRVGVVHMSAVACGNRRGVVAPCGDQERSSEPLGDGVTGI